MTLPHWEKYIFYGVILINAIPVFCFDFFPTMDGPAHLYNVQLIREILAGNDFISTYFELQSIVVPNWMGHAILFVLTSFLSPSWAEKIMLLMFFIALPLSFRFFLRRFKMSAIGIANSSLAVYLIFPLSYSVLLHLGFYNFSFGLVFFFFSMGYFFDSFQRLNFKRGVVLGLLVIATFLSHFFVFGLLLFFLFVSYIYLSVYKVKVVSFKSFLRKGFVYLFYFSPALVLCGIYLMAFQLGGQSSYLDKTELFNWIVQARTLIYFEENQYSTYFFYILLFWSILLIIDFSKSKVCSAGVKLLFFYVVVTLTLYFFMPNESSTAGFISFRLLLFFFLFWVALLGVISRKIYITIPLVLFALFSHFKIVDRFIKSGQHYSDIAREIAETSDYIEDAAFVLAVNSSGDWMKAHFSNYLGIAQGVVITDNYEASNSYFPLRWKDFSHELIVEEEMNVCFKDAINVYPYYPSYNYIFVLKGNEEDTACKDYLMQSNWQLIVEKEQMDLWKKKAADGSFNNYSW